MENEIAIRSLTLSHEDQLFHVSCCEPAVRLFQLADGRFQLIEDGPLAPFMYGRGYFLVERPLADFLRQLNLERVRLEPAVIWHRRIDREYLSHEHLLVNQYFTLDQINDIDLDGERLLSMNDEYLFASRAMKDRLEAGAFRYLCFSLGLSEFAAGG